MSKKLSSGDREAQFGMAGLRPAYRTGGRIGKLRILMVRFGWKEALYATVLWGLKRACGYRRAILYCLDLTNLREAGESTDVEWGYKSAGELDSELLSADGFDWEALERSAEDGRFFVGTSNGVQCYFSRVSDRGFIIPDRVAVTFSGNREDAYVGDCLTLEAYRGKGMYPRGLVELGKSLRCEGRGRLCLYVERENLASIRSVEKAGFRPVAACSVFRLGRFRKRNWRTRAAGSSAAVAGWSIDEAPPSRPGGSPG